MANSSVSRRGTSFKTIATHPGFRLGFLDVRRDIGWPKDDLVGHGRSFRWWYEHGRLFAASHYSRRWQAMPQQRRRVTRALINALRAARLGGVWPAHHRVQ